MDLKVTQGKTIRLPADFYAGSKRVDPIDPRVKVVNAKGVAVVRNATPVRESPGVYRYDFKVEPDAPLGIWQAIWTAQIDGRNVSGSDPFEVLPAPAAGAETHTPPRVGRAAPGGTQSTTGAARTAASGAAAAPASNPPGTRDAGKQVTGKGSESTRQAAPASPTPAPPAGNPPRTAAATGGATPPRSPSPAPVGAQAGSSVSTPAPSQGRASAPGAPSKAPETGASRAAPSAGAPKAPPAGAGKAEPARAPGRPSGAGTQAPPESRHKDSGSAGATWPAKGGKAAVPGAAAVAAMAGAVAVDVGKGEARTGLDTDLEGKRRKISPFGRKAAPDQEAGEPGARGGRLSRGQALLIVGALGVVLLAIWLSPRRSDTAQSKIDQGVAAQKAGRTEEAERLYQEVLKSDPDNKLANFNLGVSAHIAGRMEEAEILYNNSLEADPDFLPALFNLAILQEGTGRNEEAEATYRRILEDYPDNGPVHLNLGFLLTQKLNRPEDGRAEFARAVELDESLAARIPAEMRPAAPAGPPAP